jgi:hypothetical protein
MENLTPARPDARRGSRMPPRTRRAYRRYPPLSARLKANSCQRHPLSMGSEAQLGGRDAPARGDAGISSTVKIPRPRSYWRTPLCQSVQPRVQLNGRIRQRRKSHMRSCPAPAVIGSNFHCREGAHSEGAPGGAPDAAVLARRRAHSPVVADRAQTVSPPPRPLFSGGAFSTSV